MFSALAEGHGNFKDKLNIFIAVSPITNLYYATAGFIDLGKNIYDSFKNTLSFFSIHQILGPNWNYIGKALCLQIPCGIIDSWAKATVTPFNDAKVVEASNEREGSSASTKQLLHFIQTARANDFVKYDYGKDKN